MAENSLENAALNYFTGGTQDYLLTLARRGVGRGKRKTKVSEETNADMDSPFAGIELEIVDEQEQNGN